MAAVLVTLAALHFILVTAWLLPGRFLPSVVERVAHAYVTPLFVQNWWLFAPDPHLLDRRAEVRGTYQAAGEHHTTPWLPLTDPVITAARTNRLSPMNASRIVLLNAVYSLTDPRGPLRLQGAARDLILSAWAEPARQPPGLIVLERAGSALIRAAYPGRAFEHVQVRIVVRPLPPFERRHAPDHDTPATVLVFPLVPFFGDVVPWNSAG